jgi:hypothetical protein
MDYKKPKNITDHLARFRHRGRNRRDQCPGGRPGMA